MPYKFDEREVQLEANDTDVNIKLPNGQVISIQFRIESPSIDVILPFAGYVTNWIDDMNPAREGTDNTLIADQIVISLPPNVLEQD